MSDNLLMSWNQPEAKDRIELVFENRFKDYGAYTIRKNYARYKLLATVAAIGLFAITTFSMYWWYRTHHVNAGSKSRFELISNVTKTPIKKEEKKEEVKVIPQKVQAVKTQMFVPPPIDENTTQPYTPNPNDFVDKGAAMNNDIGGDFADIGGGNLGDFNNDGDDNGTGTGPLTTVDEEAKFPGGEEGFIRFVQEKFVYPERCLNEGINGNVELQFVVDKNGLISQLKITKKSDLCPEFESEAKRVLNLTNRMWTPAFLKGKPVISYRKVPIQMNINSGN